MAHNCSLCDARKARRYCMARQDEICTVCCGSKREVELDCPSSCSYLRSGREYEAERRSQVRNIAPPFAQQWEDEFLERHGQILSLLNTLILEVRRDYPEMVDGDVRATLEALRKTYETEEKGIIFDYEPDSLLQKKLYEPLREFLENPTNSENPSRPAMRVGETISCLDLMLVILESYTLPRPKSRAFLDSLEEHFGKNLSPSKSSPIILP